MARAVTRTSTARSITRFDPEQTKGNQAKLDALISYATRLQDWPLLEQAIDAKIEEQAEFVQWWDGTVRRPGQRNNAERGYFVSDAVAQTGITQQQASRWRAALGKPEQYRARLILAAYRKANLAAPENHRAQGTGENEWFTPALYIDAARSVLGDIDLDPATHPEAQSVVKASEFFTREDDGLTKDWHGRVWLNPPYAQPRIAQFVEKMVSEYASGNVSDAIMLTHNYTDTAWFHLAASTASMICFTRGRIRFIDIDGNECAPTQGQAFFYYGTDTDGFAAEFAAFGFVVVCHA